MGSKAPGAGAGANQLKPCDLVMQGGVTSGVVYPGAVIELSNTYHFVNVGGASAGAIAAAATAAAELGRQTGAPGFARMEAAMAEIRQPGFLLGLFQPSPRAKPAFTILLKLATSRAAWMRRIPEAYLAFVLTPSLVLINLAVVVLLALAWRTWTAPLPSASRWLPILLAIFTWFLIAIFLTAVKFAFVVWRLLSALQSEGYGLCPGLRQPPSSAQPGLTEWIFSKIQQCAGRSDNNPPVTFADLETAGIHLRLVTTDLSLARPVTLPLAEDSGYLFTESSLQGLLPAPVLKHLLEKSKPVPIAGVTYRSVPGQEMPVALAARLSLSFPILLSAVPLFAQHTEIQEAPLPHLLSDGGITSNFPIQFFDEWLPRHPTFGLSLQPAGQHSLKEKANDMVDLGRAVEVPRWTATNGIGGFASQIFDASRNWRDVMQAQLPGSRDRIVSIYMRAEEGGLNLDMPLAIVNALDSRGRDAGKLLVSQFNWPKHQLTRYLTWMQMMQIGLHEASASFAGFRPILTSGDLKALVASGAYDNSWRSAASTVTEALVALAASLGASNEGPLFNTPEAPQPTPVMRVVPDV
jgi:predicted acylesterase/phospholipase RssA